MKPRPTLPNRELALRSGRVLDLPPRCARLVALGGAIAAIPIAVGSLTGNSPATIAVDKLLHFGGYAALAAVLVLGLRPRRHFVALLGAVALGALIELLQPLNRRSSDPFDALANTLGVAVGAAIGLGARLAYGYLRTELETARVRRNLRAIPPGAVILQEGASIDDFFVVKRGTVALYRRQDGRQIEVARVGPGEMFGLLAAILRVPQPLMAVALTPVEVYQLDYDELIEAAGGREQPLGVIARSLAAELRAAREAIAEARGAATTPVPSSLRPRADQSPAIR